MKRATGSILIAGALLSGLGVTRAWADEGALLVVVEAPPELGLDPGEIRRAIGSELRGPTVAPAQPVSDATERALIISVDHERIAMSLRDRAGLPVTRVIRAPGERAERVRAIAWLAGNLARDQVSGIVADGPAATSPLETMPALPSPASAPPAAAPPAAATAVEPPPYQPAAVPVLAAHDNPPGESANRWFVSLEAGPVMGLSGLRVEAFRNASNFLPSATLWRLEARRLSADHRFMLGVSVEGTSSQTWGTGTGRGTWSSDPETFGAGALGGWNHHLGRWTLEEILGLGLDLAHRGTEATTTSSQTAPGGVATSTIISTGGLGGGVYGMAAVAVSHPVTDAAMMFLRLGAHLSAVDANDLFLWTSLGLSYGL